MVISTITIFNFIYGQIILEILETINYLNFFNLTFWSEHLCLVRKN